MANTPGELIKTVAAVTGVAEATVTTYHRSLREAGLVTKGGRGTSAARPTARDAARLLIAIGGSRFEKQAADRIVQDFADVTADHRAARRGFPFQSWLETAEGSAEFPGAFSFAFDDNQFEIPALQALPEGHILEEALAALITTTIREGFTRAIRRAAPGFDPHFAIEVSLFGPEAGAIIAISLGGIKGKESFTYTEEVHYHRAEPYSMPGGFSGDLKIRRDFTQTTLCAVAELMREDHYRGCDINGRPLDPHHAWNVALPDDEREAARIAAEAEIDKREREID